MKDDLTTAALMECIADALGTEGYHADEDMEVDTYRSAQLDYMRQISGALQAIMLLLLRKDIKMRERWESGE